MTDTATRPAERVPPPETLRAVPVRHPGRWVAAAVIALLLAMFAHMLVTNQAFQWRFMFDNMFRPPVIEGVRTAVTGFVAGLLGLALSEAAYMAEIVRAGIQSVDPGQQEAAQACGMGRGVTLRRIVLPQAMRVIVPPTGNETIAMLKDTALLAFVPVTNELFFQLQAIGARTFRVFPMLVAACLWYLAMTSVLMVGQFFLERYFSRGFGTGGRQARARETARSVGYG